MSFGSRLRARREQLGIRQSDLAKMLDVTPAAISNYEADVNSPKAVVLYKVFDILKCDANYLFQDEMTELTYANKATAEEFETLVRKYRRLDSYGKGLIKAVLEHECQRCEKQEEEEKSTENAYIVIPAYPRIASAGNGMYLFNGIPSELVKVPRTRISEKADFILGVNGDSMEPTYRDGDRVYVKKTEELEPGEIGIFSQGGDCYIKELGDGVLISHNPSYKDIRMTDDLRCIGRVLGRVETA